MLAMRDGQDAALSAETVATRLVADCKRDLDAGVDDRFLEHCAQQAVREVWHDSVKVTTFVPVLAMRRMREIVSSREKPVPRSGSET